MARGNVKYNNTIVGKVEKYYKEVEIPFVEEIAEILDVSDQTIVDWCKKHPEFKVVYDRLIRKQKLQLLKGSMNRDIATAGAIFQLKANHGLIESEKRIVAGDKNEPLTFKWEGNENDNDSV